jgi:hypothetical protein
MNVYIKKLNKLIRNPIFIIVLLFAVGFLLRFYNSWDNFTFGYDQGRDAQRIFDIAHLQNFKLMGQESDIPGVFHGALSYYVLVVFYVIGNFNPNIPVIFLILINLSAVLLLYFMCNLLFKNKLVGLIAALFWVVSYEQASFSRFISNASAMSIVSIIFFAGLAIYIFKKKNIGLTLSVIGFALSVQLNFYLSFLSIFYLIYYLIFRPKVNLKTLIVNFILLIILFAPYMIAEFKWNFIMSKSLTSYFLTHHGNFSIIASINSYVGKITDAIYYSIIGIDRLAILVLFIIVIIFSWFKIKDKKVKYFLFVWLFATAPLFLFSSGVLQTQLVNAVLFAPLTIIFAFFLVNVPFAKRFLIILGILFVIVSNLIIFYQDNFREIKLLSFQNFTYADEKKLIDYTYSSSNGRPFSVCALTNPLYVNSLWSYLYGVYGKEKYGYVPYWAGQEQVISKNNLPYDSSHVPLRYLIIEPAEGIPDYAKSVFVYLEDHTSSFVETKSFAGLLVQKRILNKDLSIFKDTQDLNQKEIKSIQSLIKSNPRFTCYTTYNSYK